MSRPSVVNPKKGLPILYRVALVFSVNYPVLRRIEGSRHWWRRKLVMSFDHVRLCWRAHANASEADSKAVERASRTKHAKPEGLNICRSVSASVTYQEGL